MPPTTWNTYSNTSPSQKNISLSRLAIRTRGAVISRLIFPLTVLTTMGHLPATFTPHLLYLLKKGWLSATKLKQRGTRNRISRSYNSNETSREGASSYKSVGFSLINHQPSKQIDKKITAEFKQSFPLKRVMFTCGHGN